MNNPKNGFYGEFGGKFIPETISYAIEELNENYEKIGKSEDFQNQFQSLLKEFVGRPTSLYYAKNLSDHFGGAKIYFKREDLAHLGASDLFSVCFRLWWFWRPRAHTHFARRCVWDAAAPGGMTLCRQRSRKKSASSMVGGNRRQK